MLLSSLEVHVVYRYTWWSDSFARLASIMGFLGYMRCWSSIWSTFLKLQLSLGILDPLFILLNHKFYIFNWFFIVIPLSFLHLFINDGLMLVSIVSTFVSLAHFLAFACLSSTLVVCLSLLHLLRVVSFCLLQVNIFSFRVNLVIEYQRSDDFPDIILVR